MVKFTVYYQHTYKRQFELFAWFISNSLWICFLFSFNQNKIKRGMFLIEYTSLCIIVVSDMFRESAILYGDWFYSNCSIVSHTIMVSKHVERKGDDFKWWPHIHTYIHISCISIWEKDVLYIKINIFAIWSYTPS